MASRKKRVYILQRISLNPTNLTLFDKYSGQRRAALSDDLCTTSERKKCNGAMNAHLSSMGEIAFELVSIHTHTVV